MPPSRFGRLRTPARRARAFDRPLALTPAGPSRQSIVAPDALTVSVVPALVLAAGTVALAVVAHARATGGPGR
jgi:hypothetical protein